MSDGKFDIKDTDWAGMRRVFEEAHDVALEKGWWDKYNTDADIRKSLWNEIIAAKLFLVVSELIEAGEELRDGRDPGLTYYSTKIYGQPHVGTYEAVVAKLSPGDPEPKPEGFPSELADAVIRIADIAVVNGIDLAESIRVKMEYNTGRPARHGGKTF